MKARMMFLLIVVVVMISGAIGQIQPPQYIVADTAIHFQRGVTVITQNIEQLWGTLNVVGRKMDQQDKQLKAAQEEIRKLRDDMTKLQTLDPNDKI